MEASEDRVVLSAKFHRSGGSVRFVFNAEAAKGAEMKWQEMRLR
jgi:hypothetical protein